MIDASGAVPPPAVRLPEDKDFRRTLDGLTDLLADAGLRGVQARRLRWTHVADVDSLWRGAAAGIGGIGMTVTSQTPEVRAKRFAQPRPVRSRRSPTFFRRPGSQGMSSWILHAELSTAL